MRQIIPLRSLPAPRFRYSQCVKAGPFLHMAGMIGSDPKTGQLAPGGPYAETKQILANLAAAARELGVSFADLVSVNIYTTRFDEFPAINKAWEEVFGDDLRPPARTSVGVAALPAGATVEIESRFYTTEA
jgi:2-iminobutanoate/2-iminopropanoate deaminase